MGKGSERGVVLMAPVIAIECPCGRRDDDDDAGNRGYCRTGVTAVST
jgi:hypothetical protein